MVQLKVYPQEGAGNEDAIFLDLYETQPIKLTLSIEDITSADATSVFSRTFKVPATRDNNEFFENVWELDGIDFDITIKKPAQILVDGAEFKTGHVRLQKIFRNEDLDKIDYELLFLGETRDFSSAIGEATMCQLTFTDFNWDDLPVSYSDASEYAAAVGSQRVQDSWDAFPQGSTTAGVAGGNLLFPLIDHGNEYDNNDQLISDTITIGPSGGNDHSFTHTQHAITADRFKPMIRAKRIWDQIFENSGYTYESNFLDSEQFLHMYVSAFGNQEQITIGVEQDTGGGVFGDASSQTFEYFETPNGNNDVNSYLYCSNQVVGAANYSINTPDVGPTNGGSYFTAPGSAAIGGAYYAFEFGAQVDAQIENSDYGYSAIDCAVQLCIVDVPGGNILYTLDTGNFTSNGNWSFSSYDSRNGGYQPQAGDIFQIYITPQGGYDISQVDQAYWHCMAAPGDYYPLRDLDCEYNQIDFIKDVITMFRLVMQPSASRPNHFIIEPWKDFIGSGDVYDWSDKLIREKDFLSEPLFNTQSAIIEFTKQEDEDYINKFHQDNNKHAYGWLRFDSQNELLKGKREVEVTGIAPTPIEQIIDLYNNASHSNPDFILPQVFKVDENKRVPIKPKTRFLFYNGMVTTNGTTWYLDTGAGTHLAYTTYPLVSPYEYWPIQNVVGPPPVNTLNLNFANDTRYYMNPEPSATYTEIPNTLFEIFWGRYISSLYNKFSRRVTAYFTLNNVDLQTFTFDDVIFIDGKYYRPEKVVDAQIGERTAVKVQLITLKDQRPVWRPEPLTGFSITTTDGDCSGDQGQIQVTTNGTPPFTWELGSPAFDSGTYNAPVGQAPYIFTIDNVPLGSDVVVVTDAFGRSAQATYTINESTASPITVNWTVTDATQCSSPCNGEIDVVVSGGAGAPYTITWQDPSIGNNFNPTGLCPNDYLFYVTDSAGCQTDTFEASVSCTVQTYVYQLREHLNSCTQSSAATYIATSTQQLANNTTVDLLERAGCYYIQGLSQDTPVYTIDNTYADCASCTPSVANSWEAWRCQDGQTTTRYLTYDANLQPGQVVTIDDGDDDCYVIQGTASTTPQYNHVDVFDDCETCEASSSGYVYYAYFCDGSTSPRYFQSTVLRQQGDVVEVTSGFYTGKCVTIISLNQTGFVEGNLGTTTYENCDACEGINPQTCYGVTAGAQGVTFTYVLNNQTYTASLPANGFGNYCLSSYNVTAGSATFVTRNNLCISNFDCYRRFKTSCHRLYGGSAGSQFEYQDSTGTFQNIFVVANTFTTICAVINSVTKTSGNGYYTDLQSLCSGDDDCDEISPIEP